MPAANSRPPPLTIASPFAGVDRGDSNGLIEWMSAFYIRSNFDFTGVYMTGKIPKETTQNGVVDHVFTEPSGHVSNKWVEAFPSLNASGWGFILIYVGYSIRPLFLNVMPPFDQASAANANRLNNERMKNGLPPSHLPSLAWTKPLAAERGILHAQHIKQIASGLPDCNGAIVFLDNEGGIMTDNLKEYYVQLFAELSTPGPDMMAIRPGLYGYDPIVKSLVPDWVDLFTWRIDFDEKPGRWFSRLPLSEDKTQKTSIELNDFPIRTVRFQPRRMPEMTMIPVGRQPFLDEDVAPPGIRLRSWVPDQNKTTNELVSKLGWDLDMSLVRDPRYPEANPRFSLKGETIFRGDFRKLAGPNDAGGTISLADTALSMVIRDAGNPRMEPIDENDIEPEAPIVLPTPDIIFTIFKSGQLASSRREGGKWSKMIPLPLSSPSALRRLRAVTAISAGTDGIQVFYLSSDLRVQGRRLMPGGTWTDPVPLAGGIQTHPFTNIASNQTDESVDIFFISSTGSLHISSCALGAKDWPGQVHNPLPGEQTPSLLLPGTAIAAVSPSGQHELVFTVGRDLRLNMALFTKGGSWTPPTPVGVVAERLFAHTRLAAFSPHPKLVLVAAISHQGVPIVYKLALDDGNNTWGGPRVEYAQNLRKPKPLPLGVIPLPYPFVTEKEAVGWDINPFGDISLGIQDNDTVLLCAGTTAGRTGLLMRRIDKDENWVRLLGGEKINGTLD